MRDFGEIIALAAERKGGLPALEDALAATPALAPSAVAATPDDRILAEMTRCIFNAGFSSKVIEAKWPAFEAAFKSFDPHACAFMSEEHFDTLMQDRAIVRNGAKIRAVQINAKLVLDLASSHGSAARFFADWPDSDYAGLLNVLKERGSHLSGDAGMRFLRSIGKPPSSKPSLWRGHIATSSPRLLRSTRLAPSRRPNSVGGRTSTAAI
jgi:3-methyladenine DNA glycosylase Tag